MYKKENQASSSFVKSTLRVQQEYIIKNSRSELHCKTQRFALLAQSVARVTLNHKVRGSSPLQGFSLSFLRSHYIFDVNFFPSKQPASPCTQKIFVHLYVAALDALLRVGESALHLSNETGIV